MIRDRLITFSLAAAIAVGGSSIATAGAPAATKAPETAIVGLPKPTVKPGDKCAKGTEGCRHGKFVGNFFGD